MTREEMWDEFESQLKKEIHTPVTMSYDDSVRLAELGIEETVARWKQRLEQKTGRWVLISNEEMEQDLFGFLYANNSYMNYKCSECGFMVHNTLRGIWDENRTQYCPKCGAKMEGEE